MPSGRHWVPAPPPLCWIVWILWWTCRAGHPADPTALAPSGTRVPPAGVAEQQEEEIPPEYLTESHTKTVTVPRGQTVYLHCTVQKMAEKSVSWIRLRDFHLLTVGEYTYTSDSRYKIVQGKTPEDYVLQINYPQPSDEGLYECQVNAEPSLSTYVYLRVVVPKAKITGGPDLYVEAGSDINLTCTITQSPEMPAFVFWFHDDRMINYDGERREITLQRDTGQDRTALSRLVIRDAQLSYSGNYTCSASNAEPVTVLVHVVKGEHQVAVQHDARQPNPRASSPRASSLPLAHWRVISWLLYELSSRCIYR